MLNSNNFLMELTNTRISYNKPCYVNCPVCTGINTLFLLHTPKLTWGYCTGCLSAGAVKDWEDCCVHGKPFDNFYYKADKMFRKYAARVDKNIANPQQVQLLRNLGYGLFASSAESPVGLTSITEFYADLKDALINSDIILKKRGYYTIEDKPSVIIPLYYSKHQIVGFTIYDGKCFHSFYPEEYRYNIYYQQGNQYNARELFIPENLKSMLHLQAIRADLNKSPANLIVPFYPFNYINKKTGKTSSTTHLRHTDPQKAYFMTYNKPWAIQQGCRLSRHCSVYFYKNTIPLEPDFPMLYVIREPEKYFEPIGDHFKKLDMEDRLITDYSKTPKDVPKYFIHENSIFQNSKKGLYKVTKYVIHIEHEKDPQLFSLYISTDKEIQIHRYINVRVFEDIECLNSLLNLCKTGKKEAYFLDFPKKQSILLVLLSLQSITRRYIHEQKKEKRQTEYPKPLP